MYGSREFEIALITLCVAVAACCIADYGVGIMFGVLTCGAACFVVICIYQLSDLSSTKRSRAGQSAGMAVRGLMPGLEDDHDRFVRGGIATPTGTSLTSSLWTLWRSMGPTPHRDLPLRRPRLGAFFFRRPGAWHRRRQPWPVAAEVAVRGSLATASSSAANAR